MSIPEIPTAAAAAPASDASIAKKKKAGQSAYAIARSVLGKYVDVLKVKQETSVPAGHEESVVHCWYSGASMLAKDAFHIAAANTNDVETKCKSPDFLARFRKNRLVGDFIHPVAAQAFIESLLKYAESVLPDTDEKKPKVLAVIKSWIQYTRDYYNCHHTPCASGADDLLLAEIKTIAPEDLLRVRPADHHLSNVAGTVSFHVKVARASKRKADVAGVGEDDASPKRQQTSSAADEQVTAALVSHLPQ